MTQINSTPARFRILAIDDDQVMLSIYRKIVPSSPFAPDCPQQAQNPTIEYLLDTAQNGLDGIEQIETALEAQDPYCIVYLDMRIPDMSGMEIAQRIRQLDPMVMIILVTAYEDHNLVEAREELGSNFEFFAKPVDDKELLKLTCIFSGYWQHTQQAMKQREFKRLNTPHPKYHNHREQLTRIMFVDDSATVRAVYSELLRSVGHYEVAVAGSMAEAIELSERFVPDISILDYYMPGGNGDELAQWLLQNELTKNTLILVLTQKEEVEEIMLNVGAVDILYKDDPTRIFLQRVGAMERYIRTQIDLRDSIEAQSRIANEQERSQIQVNEAKLRWQWLESVISTIPVSLLILDSDRTIQQLNPAAIQLMRHSSKVLIGTKIDALLEPSKTQQGFDYQLRGKEGTPIPVSISHAPLNLLSPADDTPGEVLIIHDLRERITMEQERASQANQLAYQSGLSEMSANVLHNIGNTIGGMSWQVLALQKSIKQLESVHQGLKSGLQCTDVETLHKGLNRALEDLERLNSNRLTSHATDIAKSIEYVGEVIRVQQSVAQEQNLYLMSFDLQEAIEDVLLIERETNRTHNVSIEYEIDAKLEPASLPYNQFMQLLSNLIKNSREAIVEQREQSVQPELAGTISIRVKTADEGSRFTLSLSDNGCGIDAERLNTIFQRGESSKQSGSGFGLHAVATFIQSLDGTIQAKSDGLGQGATMVLELPMHARKIPQTPRISAS